VFNGSGIAYNSPSHQKTMASVYAKLNAARTELQSRELKKSGRNKFAGYNYIELGAVLPVVQAIFAEIGLCGVVSYGADTAELTIFDCDSPEQTIKISSPMSSAALKGAHDIQNLGAVQTYLRRYLWVTAMEIVEHDELDATLGAPRSEGKASKDASAAQKPSASKEPYLPGDKFTPVAKDPMWRLLEAKLQDMGITPFGMKTVLTVCKSESLQAVSESRLSQFYDAVTPEMVSKFNAGKNSKGTQVVAPPVTDKPRNNNIEELERAAAALFDDSDEG
jgi:hypothetical protein